MSRTAETDEEIIDQLDKVFYNGVIIKRNKHYDGVIVRKARDGIPGSYHVSSLCGLASAFITLETCVSILAGNQVTIKLS